MTLDKEGVRCVLTSLKAASVPEVGPLATFHSLGYGTASSASKLDQTRAGCLKNFPAREKPYLGAAESLREETMSGVAWLAVWSQDKELLLLFPSLRDSLKCLFFANTLKQQTKKRKSPIT